MMKYLLTGAAIAVTLSLATGIPVHSNAVTADQGRPDLTADQGRPDLAAIFNGNFHQEVDRFGNVSRTAYDTSGRVIGTQVGTYSPGTSNGMTIEMTYLQPGAGHPRGQAFDGAGNPAALH